MVTTGPERVVHAGVLPKHSPAGCLAARPPPSQLVRPLLPGARLPISCRGSASSFGLGLNQRHPRQMLTLWPVVQPSLAPISIPLPPVSPDRRNRALMRADRAAVALAPTVSSQ